jgi:probable addiction module antidote protein
MKMGKMKTEDLLDFDPAVYLDNPETVAAYLNDVMAAGHPGLLAQALGDIARARGMTEIARESGIAREALYKALRGDSSPRFETISKVCAALGLQMTLTVKTAPHEAGRHAT